VRVLVVVLVESTGPPSVLDGRPPGPDDEHHDGGLLHRAVDGLVPVRAGIQRIEVEEHPVLAEDRPELVVDPPAPTEAVVAAIADEDAVGHRSTMVESRSIGHRISTTS